jgi:hypothetical protein
MTDPDLHLTRRESERLLDDPAAFDHVLGWALTAARGPAHRDELRREDLEASAFHAARLAPPPATRSNYVAPSALGRRAAARAVVATGAVVALTSGGFALASSVDLPTLPGRASDQATEAVARTPKATETTTPTSPSSPTSLTSSAPAEDASDETEEPGAAESTEAAPTPSFRGLCKAYQATDRSKAGKALDSAAFTALATEAGGADNITTYCVALIGEPKETGKPSELPTPTGKPTPGKPTSTPTGKPSVVPTPTTRPTPAKPTDRPTGKPSSHPSGKPTDKPAPGKGGRNN